MQDQEPPEEQAEATKAGEPLTEQGTTTLLGHTAQVDIHMLQRENKVGAWLSK
jgi:hypothetical protein